MRLRWKIASALALGGVANTLLAWSCAVWLRPTGSTYYFPSPIPERLSVHLPQDWLAPPPPVPLKPQPEAQSLFVDRRTKLHITYVERPGFGASMIEVIVDHDPMGFRINGLDHDHTLRCLRAGWPMTAWEGIATVDGDTTSGWTFAAMAPAPGWCQPGVQTGVQTEPIGIIRGKVYVPLRPRPLGLVCNTLVFAAPFLAPMMFLECVRRWRLRRRGCCAECGYDRRGLVGGADAKCPECGTVPAPTTLPTK